jgi:hypothetical protein
MSDGQTEVVIVDQTQLADRLLLHKKAQEEG